MAAVDGSVIRMVYRRLAAVLTNVLISWAATLAMTAVTTTRSSR